MSTDRLEQRTFNTASCSTQQQSAELPLNIMVDHNLIVEIDLDETAVDALITNVVKKKNIVVNIPEGSISEEDALDATATFTKNALMENVLDGDTEQNLRRGRILQGRIVGKAGDDAVIDVGLKSEGLVNKNEFDNFDSLKMGDTIEVLLEDLEDESGIIKLSKRKADRIRGWERILESNNEGDIIEGKATRKIKGGLLVDIGVPVLTGQSLRIFV